MSEPTQRHDVTNEPPQALIEEFTMLMSLALDDMLDGSDRERFDALVRDFPVMAELWSDWQAVDQQLDALPHAEPVAGFGLRFEQRLAHQQQQQQQRVVTVSLIAVFLTVGLGVLGMMSAGAYILATQGPWLGEQLQNLVYLSVAVSTWFGALTNTLAALANSPQAQTLGIVYVLLVAVMIVGSLQMLRRSADLSDAIAMPGLE